MEIKPEDYVLGVWFAEDKKGDNFLLTILKRDNKWLGEYRFRYKQDDKVFDSEDKKSFYSFQVDDASEQKMVDSATSLFKLVSMKYDHFQEISMIRGDFEKMISVLENSPWFNAKQVKIGD